MFNWLEILYVSKLGKDPIHGCTDEGHREALKLSIATVSKVLNQKDSKLTELTHQ